MLVSVIICTFNRADSLASLLETLSAQEDVDFRDIEVLVVDNNSSDDTRTVAERFSTCLPLCTVYEAQQGLAIARNRGIAESCGDVLLFVDDDVRLEAHWLRAYLDAFRDYPGAGFFGGRIRPDWQRSPRPGWLRDDQMPLLSGVLVAFDFGQATRPYQGDDVGPVGASFAVCRRLFEAHGMFRSDLGVIGTGRGRGEDTEFLERVRGRGETGIYVGEALCWHRVHSERLTIAGLFRHGLAKGRYHRALAGGCPEGSIARAGLFVLRGLFQLLKGRGDRFRQCVINAGLEIGKTHPEWTF